jgi:hypothetical protein
VKSPIAKKRDNACTEKKEEEGRMTIEVGGKLKNKMTQDLFRIARIENDRVVMLEDEKGLVRIWFPKQHLGSYFEEVKGM